MKNNHSEFFSSNHKSKLNGSSLTIGSLCGLICFLLCIINPVAQISKYATFFASGLCSLFFITLCIMYKGYVRIPNIRNGLPILFLFVMMFVSSIWAPFPRESLWRACIHLVFLWIFITAFIAVSNRNVKWFYYIVIFMPYLVLIEFLLIYHQYGTIRPESREISEAIGSFSNVAPAIVTPLIPFHIYFHLIRWERPLNYLSFYSAIIVVLLSQSRGGYLMLFIILLGSPFLFSTNFWGRIFFLKKILAVSIIAICSIVILFGYESTIGSVTERFSSSQLVHFFSADSPVKGEGDYRRFVQYATGISIIKSHPIKGIGFHGFSAYMGEMLANTDGSVSHNIFSTVWGEMGILGLFAFIWLVYSAVTNIFRGRSYNKRLHNRPGFLFYSALAMAVLVILLDAQFRPQLTNPAFYVIFALSFYPIQGWQHSQKQNHLALNNNLLHHEPIS